MYNLWQSKCDKITKFKLKCAKCKLKGAKGQNCTNSRVQKVKTANSRVQKYRGHGSCKISILLCFTSPFQNLYPQLLHPWVCRFDLLHLSTCSGVLLHPQICSIDLLYPSMCKFCTFIPLSFNFVMFGLPYILAYSLCTSMLMTLCTQFSWYWRYWMSGSYGKSWVLCWYE